MSGKLDLLHITFPIKLMCPRTMGENMFFHSISLSNKFLIFKAVYFPLYLNRAIRTTDPLERFKFYMVAILAANYHSDEGNMYWFKPLNPIIGETFTGFYKDGTLLYQEQIFHHPTIPYFFMTGPNKEYRCYGFWDLRIKAGWNKAQVINSGYRTIEFKDG